MAKRCLYKRYHLPSRWIIVSPFPPHRNASYFDLSLRSLASAVSESQHFFAACEDCAARLALSLPQRLDNRVSSSSALSEARLIFLRYLSLVQNVVKTLQFYARVVVELD